MPTTKFSWLKMCILLVLLILLIALAVVPLLICRLDDIHRSNLLTLFLFRQCDANESPSLGCIHASAANQRSSFALPTLCRCQSTRILSIWWHCRYRYSGKTTMNRSRTWLSYSRSMKRSIKSDWIASIWISLEWNSTMKTCVMSRTNRSGSIFNMNKLYFSSNNRFQ